MSTRAVVFAYSEIGVQCLSTLLDNGVQVPLVVTHTDDLYETRWFASVAELARARGIETLMPADPNCVDVMNRVRAAQPDFLFSFYFRQILRPELLALAPHGALNMHGSLLPKYRGRAPLNWAIVNGETETGVTLHYMEERPDAGPIVDRESVPIPPDETAIWVFAKMTQAAGRVLKRSLPGLIAGTAPAQPQDLSQGSYFGRRTPEDGIIDWTASAKRIHDLVRAVAPPYPGAWTALDSRLIKITRTRSDGGTAGGLRAGQLLGHEDRLWVCAGDGKTLEILSLEIEGTATDPVAFARELIQRNDGQPVQLTRPSTLPR